MTPTEIRTRYPSETPRQIVSLSFNPMCVSDSLAIGKKNTLVMILSVKHREKLEQVDRDLDAMVDAIKKYAHDHGGTNPSSLDALVPEYLRKLPKDPFATASTAAEKPVRGYRQSLDGWGYQYKLDSLMFIHVASVGLPRFPYLGKQNYGLYRA